MKRADVAMYSAKRTGKGRFVGYNQPQHGRDRADHRMRQALLADIVSNRVQVAFQPIMRVRDGQLFAHEALARWTFLGRRIPPIEFLRLLSDCTALGQLDLNVLRLALGDTNPHQGVRVSTNASFGRLADAGMFAEMAAVVSDGPLPPEKVIVEISEKDPTDVATSVRVADRLRDLGVRIALDDFGIGYSNLDRLLAIQPDIVKIDRSFVAALHRPGASTAALQSMIRMCHDLGAEVIGEGVETQSQRRTLEELGCDAIQGFLCGRPALAVVGSSSGVDQQAS
jgi:EAL domain-containing protein (putative c-di-GMP-specific phosphodiesterase class I)